MIRRRPPPGGRCSENRATADHFRSELGGGDDMATVEQRELVPRDDPAVREGARASVRQREEWRVAGFDKGGQLTSGHDMDGPRDRVARRDKDQIVRLLENAQLDRRIRGYGRPGLA